MLTAHEKCREANVQMPCTRISREWMHFTHIIFVGTNFAMVHKRPAVTGLRVHLTEVSKSCNDNLIFK